MRRAAEILAFGGVALALHAAAIPGLTGGGEPGAGDGGSESVSVRGASPALAAMVESWDRPPAPETPAATLAAPAPAPPTAPPRAAAPALPRHPEPVRPPEDPAADRAPAAGSVVPAPPPPPPPPAAAAEPPPRSAAAPPPPAPSAPPAPAPQRAQGSGDGAAGGSARSTAPAVSDGDRASLMADWGGRIRAQIARSAPRSNARGTATLHLTVARDGRLVNASLSNSSGNASVDQAALDAVRRAGRFPAAPAGLTAAQYSFNLPLRFR